MLASGGPCSAHPPASRPVPTRISATAIVVGRLDLREGGLEGAEARVAQVGDADDPGLFQLHEVADVVRAPLTASNDGDTDHLLVPSCFRGFFDFPGQVGSRPHLLLGVLRDAERLPPRDRRVAYALFGKANYVLEAAAVKETLSRPLNSPA